MNLTEESSSVTWPRTHYVFVERTGPFHETAPLAWKQLHRLVAAVADHNEITGYISLYRMGPSLYRAGVSLAGRPEQMPEGLAYEEFAGGAYRCFTLTGPYAQLGEATRRVFQIVVETEAEVRDEFCIENYVNDPRSTPEEELITEILIPAE